MVILIFRMCLSFSHLLTEKIMDTLLQTARTSFFCFVCNHKDTKEHKEMKWQTFVFLCALVVKNFAAKAVLCSRLQLDCPLPQGGRFEPSFQRRRESRRKA